MGIEHMVGGLHSLMPDTKTVLFRKRIAGDNWDDGITVINAEKRPLSTENALAAGIGLDEVRAEWRLWKANLQGMEPENGDKFELDGETWHVKRSNANLLGQCFHLACVRER